MVKKVFVNWVSEQSILQGQNRMWKGRKLYIYWMYLYKIVIKIKFQFFWSLRFEQNKRMRCVQKITKSLVQMRGSSEDEVGDLGQFLFEGF